jgi:hypothetical protein
VSKAVVGRNDGRSLAGTSLAPEAWVRGWCVDLDLERFESIVRFRQGCTRLSMYWTACPDWALCDNHLSGLDCKVKRI